MNYTTDQRLMDSRLLSHPIRDWYLGLMVCGSQSFSLDPSCAETRAKTGNRTL
jgi:hypothetical protein